VIPLRDNLPTDRFPVITAAIIAINVLVFLFLQGPSFSLSSGQEVDSKPIIEYGAIPYRITHPGDRCRFVEVKDGGPDEERLFCEKTEGFREAAALPNCDSTAPGEVCREAITQPPAFLTIFTSMFMHGGWLHILFNMLFLWIFGNNIEDSMGKGRYIAFYLLGGLAAGLTQVAVSPDSTTPLVGASGAIAGVLGGYALLYPRARVLTLLFVFFIFLVEIPALVLLGIWIFLQFLPAVGQLASPDVGSQGGVAYFAHVGGFLFGLAAIKLFATRRSAAYGGGGPRYPVY
jgi:membrane associated rhomboid family serine protease